MKTLIFLCMFFGMQGNVLLASSKTEAPTDSIGIKIINNKSFIMHRVDPQETLSALSRRYEVSVESIIGANNGLTESLKVGQVVYVPFIKKEKQPLTEKRIYVVKTSETLYGISKRFKMSIDEISELNNLQSTDIQQGQELIVLVPKPVQAAAVIGPMAATTPAVTPGAATEKAAAANPFMQVAAEAPAAGATTEVIEVVADQQKIPKMHTVMTGEFLYPLSKKLAVSKDSIFKWNNLQSDQLQAGQELIVGYDFYQGNKLVNSVGANTGFELAYAPGGGNSMENQLKASGSIPQPGQSGFKVIGSEDGVPASKKISGVGAMIKSRSGSGASQYVALHPSAEYGSYAKVTNPSNGTSTVVKIIGKIPPGEGKNLLIMLSEAACNQIGIINKEFPIQISYNN